MAIAGNRILVVENERIVALNLERRLSKLGYEVPAVASSGAQVLERLNDWRPDLVLMDIHLDGDLDGIETANRIPNELYLPIIYLTAYSDNGTLARARATKPYGYLIKPFSERELHATIQMALQRRRTELALHDSEDRLRLALDAANMGSWDLDVETGEMICLGLTHRILGLNSSTNSSPWHFFLDRIHPEDRAAVAAAMQWPPPETQGQLEFRFRTDDGELRWIRAMGKVFPHREGHIIGTVQDVTERRLAEERLREAEADLFHLAHHDPLTGLPNRLFALDRLDHAVERCKRGHTQLALLFIDLDNFKRINDTLGHSVGDDLLRAVAERMRGSIRSSDTLARLGGDEFMILLDEIHREEDAQIFAEKIIRSIGDAVAIAGTEWRVSASIGISLFPGDGSSGEELIRAADIAMYVAKEAGRGRYTRYAREMTGEAMRYLAREQELRRALELGQFELFYQPQLELDGGALVGAEALIRWRHPERGLVGAHEVIPVAEDSGLILRLGDWVLRRACEQARRWDAAGLPPLRMAINVPARQLLGACFVETVRRTLRETGLPPERLEIEITESTLQSGAASVVVLEQLRELGVWLAIDDFGTGYSSLSSLKRLPVQRVKIDREFIRDIPADRNDVAIAEAIVAMAHRLNLKVVAEGIETGEQEAVMRACGCDEGQGYLYAKPLPADRFAEQFGPGA